MSAVTAPTLHCTRDALDAVRRLRLEQGRPQATFRIDVRLGGCQGFKVYFDLDTVAEDDVVVPAAADVSIVVQRDALPLVAGGVLDWENSHRGTGFRLASPRARSSCGCGQAFYANLEDETG